MAFDALDLAFGKGHRCKKKMLSKSSRWWNTRPCIQATWRSAIQLKRVLMVIDKYPLLAKKAKDYAVWRIAAQSYIEEKNILERNKKLSFARDELKKCRMYN